MVNSMLTTLSYDSIIIIHIHTKRQVAAGGHGIPDAQSRLVRMQKSNLIIIPLFLIYTHVCGGYYY